MPLILLIRHGENDYVKKGRLAGRLPEVHLNKKGQAQAQAMAEALAGKLKGVPIKKLYSSPLERTMETAAPIAAALGCEVIPDENLIEINIGDWQDRTLKSLHRLKVWRQVQSTPSLFRFPGGETFAEAQNRICNEINRLAFGADPKEILILVTHADPIKLAVAYYLGMPLDCFQRVGVSPGSLTSVFVSEGGSGVFSLNVDPAFFLPVMPEEKKEKPGRVKTATNGKHAKQE